MSTVVLEIAETPHVAIEANTGVIVLEAVEQPHVVIEIIETVIRLEMSDAVVTITTDNDSFLYDDATAIVFDDGSKVELT